MIVSIVVVRSIVVVGSIVVGPMDITVAFEIVVVVLAVGCCCAGDGEIVDEDDSILSLIFACTVAATEKNFPLASYKLHPLQSAYIYK